MDVDVAHSGTHRSRVVVSIETELKPRAAAETDDTDTSQRRTDGKRFDQLHDETEHGSVPVLITTTCRIHNARRVIENNGDLRLFGTDCTNTQAVQSVSHMIGNVSYVSTSWSPVYNVNQCILNVPLCI